MMTSLAILSLPPHQWSELIPAAILIGIAVLGRYSSRWEDEKRLLRKAEALKEIR
jgi:hypothetical protein